MTMLDTGPRGAVVGASVRDRAAVASTRRLRFLEVVGRAIVRRAIGRVQIGSVSIDDTARGETLSSPHSVRDTNDCLATAAPDAALRVLDPALFSAAAFGGSLGIAEAYIDGAWESDDLAGLIETMTANLAAMDSLESPLVKLSGPISRLAYWLERNTRAGSRRNIVAHYDLGNEFFGLFLDPTMSYSCGVFENGAQTLGESQIEKIDRACRKLDLQPSDHLLEIGTGWGALAVHAAARYGCRVTTTTISDEQHRLATQRVRNAGLADRVTLLKQDYRDLTGRFDKLVSIEMVEAVGAAQLPTFFRVCSDRLKPEGAALIQAIVIRDQFFARASRRRDFLKKYIFPGSCLPSVEVMNRAVATRTDLRTWHAEDLAPHYAETLRLWREAFMGRLEDVRALGFDERFIRMWEYYLAYCEGAFRARHVGVVQTLLTKPLSRIAPASERAAGQAARGEIPT